jgi:hypothetical protein
MQKKSFRQRNHEIPPGEENFLAMDMDDLHGLIADSEAESEDEEDPLHAESHEYIPPLEIKMGNILPVEDKSQSMDIDDEDEKKESAGSEGA